MNYGDSSSSRGRAQIPGPNGDPGSERSPRGNGWSGAPEGGASARASVTPRGAGGRAPVSGVPPAPRGAAGAAPVGRAGAGRASVPVSPAPGVSGRAGAGRASVPVSPAGPAGRASVGAASVGGAGRASVGAAPVGGRAAVARANVPGFGGGGPGGPGGPGVPLGPARGGRGDDSARSKKRRRLNMLIAGFAVFIMLAGIGVVSFTWYSQKVLLPEDTIPPLSTTIYDRTGKTSIARIGDQNRQLVTIQQIPVWVQHAVAAAEDRNFYRHSGVDYKGIARAAWNNVSGGDKQGASTITQQYARNAFDNLNQDTYGRKVKEAILASKLNDKYDKSVIMQHYLNVIYFGRGAYGIQAAARTYFGKDVAKLTVAEGAVLAALIKQPEPSATHQGYDPAINPQAALDRWNYVINGMITEKWLDAPNTPPHPDKYPTNILKPSKNSAGGFGIDTPYGNVVNYVSQELREMKLCTDNEAEATDKKPLCAKALSRGGYRVTTTIDAKVQSAAVAAAQRAKKGSELAGQPGNLMAALVSIDPSNGEVRAYYGGDNGTGTDYAGKNVDNGVVSGGHSPGSSFKIYTLAAALDEGISLKSRWKGKSFKPDKMEFTVSNAGFDASCGNSCTLEQSTLKSLNVPFYYITEKIGPDKVLDMAKKAGVSTMWRTDTNPAKAYDLAKYDAKDLAPDPFFHVIGYGQYPITVLDHANGVATFANQGFYNKAHFIRKVEKQNPDTGKWDLLKTVKTTPEQRIKKDVVADVTSVLEEYPGQVNRRLDDGRKAAEKTGTWELNAKTLDNGDAWMIGYTPQLATAVWVGNKDARKAIKDKDGNKISGAKMPGAIFQRFMNDALKGEPKEDFPPAANIGKDDVGNGEMPAAPPPTPGGANCDPLGLFCPDGNQGGGNQGGGNPGGGNPGGGGDQGGGLPGFPGGGGRGGGVLPTTPPTRQTN
ncbi:transglycosylase domain-containing protein [Micromonospora sp. WMMD980]|uniref:transglycosylase domain-containing protein n=1 Tax=Micromonospora sp. WMMD980 TaxID=3016088 RepID=UPI002417050A|nr:transglycosylase domain-containing protein [Micromonospora sp. WMMD980]MDG4804040.1 transglycosylase domain-containing protein [Micromonospora sp. WMMD980]